MQAILPIEVYEALERNIGHDDAKLVVKSFETAISANIENTWAVTKDDLLSEMEKKFASKSDLLQVKTELNGKIDMVRTEIQQVKTELNGKIDMVRTELKAEIQQVKTELKAEIQQVKTELSAQLKLYFLILIFVIILTNPNALDLIAKILGLAK
jgi:RecB family exonuclease